MSGTVQETFEQLRVQFNEATRLLHEQQQLLAVQRAETERLTHALGDQMVLVERLRARVMAKDGEQALERASWRRKERDLKGDIAAMKKTVSMARGSSAVSLSSR